MSCCLQRCKEKHSDLKSYSGPYCFKGLGGSRGFHVCGSCDVQNIAFIHVQKCFCVKAY